MSQPAVIEPLQQSRTVTHNHFKAKCISDQSEELNMNAHMLAQCISRQMAKAFANDKVDNVISAMGHAFTICKIALSHDSV